MVQSSRDRPESATKLRHLPINRPLPTIPVKPCWLPPQTPKPCVSPASPSQLQPIEGIRLRACRVWSMNDSTDMWKLRLEGQTVSRVPTLMLEDIGMSKWYLSDLSSSAEDFQSLDTSIRNDGHLHMCPYPILEWHAGNQIIALKDVLGIGLTWLLSTDQ